MGEGCGNSAARLAISAHVGRDAELVRACARGDIGVRAGVHVRVDPHRHGRALPTCPATSASACSLARRFDVERAYARLQAFRHLARVLPTPAKTMRSAGKPIRFAR